MLATEIRHSRNVTIHQAFEQAVQHHQSGRLAEAEGLYRQILAAQPDHAEVLHMLGLLAHQAGHHDAAAELIGQAIALMPENAACRSNLTDVERVRRRFDAALAAGHRAIELRPDFAHAHNNLGNVFTDMGRPAEAIAAYRRTLELTPDDAEVCRNLANVLHATGRLEEAIAVFRTAVALQPDVAEAHHNLGNALLDTDRLAEAIGEHRLAIGLRPDFAEAHSSLGAGLRADGRFDEAIAAFRRAIELKPAFPNARIHLANALKDVGRVDEAVEACRSAVELNPDHASARMTLGTLELLAGDFERGWLNYEARWKKADFTSPKRDFQKPIWDGSPLEGRTLLIHAEQGFGDSIQFIRYAALAAGCGGPVVVECQRLLLDVFSTVPGIGQLVAAGDPLPHFDVHIPVMSLPLAFRTMLETIPRNVPYVSADAGRRQFWRDWIGCENSRLKVGLVWAGRPTHLHDRRRSLQLGQLLPLFGVQGVGFINLQMDDRAAQIQELSAGQRILDPSGSIADFADTAALVAELDLVIAVDTAVAHLAGALGKPVWVLLPFSPDWRWLLGREDSPWYPTMRLFRQQRAKEWEPVIAEVRKQLQTLTEVRA